MNKKNIIQIIVYFLATILFLIWIYRLFKVGFEHFNVPICNGILFLASFLYQFIAFITHCWKRNKHEIGVHLLHLIIIIILLYVQLGSFFISISSSVGEPSKYPLQ